MKTAQLIIEFPETVIAASFIFMTILGLSQPLADRGIDPRLMQVAGIAWVAILVVKLALKAFDLGKVSVGKNEERDRP